MTRPRLILLDTNVVLRLFELGAWESVTKRFQIVLTEAVAVRQVPLGGIERFKK